jgi:choline dehydrogenase
MRLADEITASVPLAQVLGRRLVPEEGVDTDDDLIADLRRRVNLLLYHPVGTCRMGPGEDAVVDPERRVRGIDGLRGSTPRRS